MSGPHEMTEKISAIYRWIKKNQESATKARGTAKNPNNGQAIMLAGKVKAYTDVMCFIHDRYPEHLQDGLWTGSKKKELE